MITPELQKKIDQAIKLLRLANVSASALGQPVEISYSGGKDSDVILQLAKEAGINYHAIYKNTTIDPPGTIKHARDMGAEVLQPKKSFFQLIAEKGYPTRRARFCCRDLKEYKVLDVAVQGIRRSESAARKERYHEPQICRFYGSKKNHVSVFLPILEWTNEDVKNFIDERKIQCHSLYYDDKGKFHVERRLGCMGCPMQSDNGLADFKANTALLRAYLRGGGGYIIFNHIQIRRADENFATNTNYLCITYSTIRTNHSKKRSMVCLEP